MMADATQPMEDFSPILIQNYIRFETAYNLVQNEDAGNTDFEKAVKFKISKDNYEQMLAFEVQAPLIGLDLSYDETAEVLTATPTEYFLNEYQNKIMRDVAGKQHNDSLTRYSKFIQKIDA